MTCGGKANLSKLFYRTLSLVTEKKNVSPAKKKLHSIYFSGHDLFIQYVVVLIDSLILWSCVQVCIHYFTCSELEQVTRVKSSV